MDCDLSNHRPVQWVRSYYRKTWLYEIKGNGKTKKKNMHKVNNPNMIIPDRLDKKKISLYASDDDNTKCIQECDTGDSNCYSQCITETESGSQYYSEKYSSHLEFESPGGTSEMFDSFTDEFAKSKEERNNKRRSKRNDNDKEEDAEYLAPSTNMDTGFVNIHVVICATVSDLFYDFVGQNYQATLYEVECFIGLLFNEMSIMMNTLKFWNETYTSTDGKQYKLDINVKIEDIEFTEFSDGAFTTVPPIVGNLDNEGYLVHSNHYDTNRQYLYSTGFLQDYPYYMRDRYNASRVFQHILVVTEMNKVYSVSAGYDNLCKQHGISYDIASTSCTVLDNGIIILDKKNPGTLGITFSGALCRDFSAYTYDIRVSVNEMFKSFLARTLTHELGHRFTSDELNMCLFTKRPSRKQFLEQFCQGLPGSKYDLDAQCKLFHDLNSSVCWSSSNALESGYVDHERCQILYRNNSYEILHKCTKNGQCSDGYLVLTIFDST